MHAVVLAGGKGTRLRPLTDARPKPLLPFMGEPFAVGLLRRLVAVGVTDVTFLVGQDARPWALLEPAAAELGVALDVRTEEAPLDTAGGARRLFAHGLRSAVLVCNGDICTDLDFATLLAAHRAASATATIALTIVEDTSAFGVVVCDADGRVERFVEKPRPGTVDARTVNAGTYVLAADVFARFPGDGPLSFERDVFPRLVAAGATVVGVAADGYWQDLGTPARYLAGHRDVLEGRCNWPLAPAMQVRGSLAAVHATAEVDPTAVLGPAAVVGAHCRLGEGVELHEAVLHEAVQVGASASIVGSVIGPGVTLPPGARVGPGQVLVNDAARGTAE